MVERRTEVALGGRKMGRARIFVPHRRGTIPKVEKKKKNRTEYLFQSNLCHRSHEFLYLYFCFFFFLNSRESRCSYHIATFVIRNIPSPIRSVLFHFPATPPSLFSLPLSRSSFRVRREILFSTIRIKLGKIIERKIFFFIRLEIRIATKGVAINATNRKFYRFNFPPEILPRVEKKDGGVGGARI